MQISKIEKIEKNGKIFSKLQSQNQRNAVIYPNIKAKVIQESFLFYSV
jgi:hypothetical protein